MHVVSFGKPKDSTSILEACLVSKRPYSTSVFKALPDKIDIKRHLPSIPYLLAFEK